MGAITVNVAIQVDRPASEVFAYLSDFEKNPTWQRGMKACTFTSDPPLRVGSTYDQVAEFLGRTVESHFEVLEYEPGRLVTAQSTSGTFPITFTRRVTSTGDQSSRVEATIVGDASGVFRLATPVMGWLVRRSINADYGRLKTLLEGA